MIDKLLIIGFLCFGCAAAGADEHGDKTYRWEDRNGNVYYSDRPPPANARNVRSGRVDGETPPQSLPYELQLAVSKFPVTIYVTSDCGSLCDRAGALLVDRGVPHTVLDAMRPDVNEKLNALTNGQPAVPVAEIGKIVVQGFDKRRWNAALDTAGYPRYAMISVTPNVPAADNTGADDDDSNDDDSDDFESDEFDDETEFEDEDEY
jgi:hypothetical protein